MSKKARNLIAKMFETELLKVSKLIEEYVE